MYILAVMPISGISGLLELISTMCQAVCFPISRAQDPLNDSFDDKKFWKQAGYNTYELSYAENSGGLIKVFTEGLKPRGYFISNSCT